MFILKMFISGIKNDFKRYILKINIQPGFMSFSYAMYFLIKRAKSYS